MDPIGLAASIVTLFQTGLNSYRMWESYRQMGAESNIILTKLEIEEARFRLWGERWDLESGNGERFALSFSDKPTILIMVEKTLQQLDGLFEKSKKWKQRLGSAAAYDTFEEPEPIIKGGALQTIKKFGISSTLSHIRRRSSKVKNKVKWLLPAGREEFESLIHQIQKTTDILSEITSHQILEEILSAALLATRNSAAAVAEISDASDKTGSLLNHFAVLRKRTIEIDQTLPGKIGRPWSPHSKMERSSDTEEPLETLLIIDAEDITLEQDLTNGRSLNIYKRSLVLCQWESEQQVWHGGAGDLKWKWKIQNERVAAVAKQLNHIHIQQERSHYKDLIRTLQCCGYIYRDPETFDAKFTYVYKLPTHISSPDGRCTSLLQALSIQASSFFLGDRLRLARLIARTIFSLHLSGLLHKSFNSSNIIFFGKGSNEDSSSACFTSWNDSLSIREPYVIGFEYSRPSREIQFSGPSKFELDLYVHPSYPKTEFREEYDIYSLGLVLLEIGLWKPIEEIWRDFEKAEDLEPWAPCPESESNTYRQRALEVFQSSTEAHDYKTWLYYAGTNHGSEKEKMRFMNYVLGVTNQLGSICGVAWMEVVRWCLECSYNEGVTQQKYFEKVVQRLDALKI